MYGVNSVGWPMQRMKRKKFDHTIGRGPGNVSKALGIFTTHTGSSLTGNEIFIAEDDFMIDPQQVGVSKRIGVDYAGEHAEWHYRFFIKGNKFVSGKIK